MPNPPPSDLPADSPHRAGYVLAWIVLAASLALALLSWRAASQREAQARSTRFDAASHEVVELVRQHLFGYELTLRGGVALFATVARPTPTQWQAYAEGFDLKRFEALTGLGFAPLVTGGGLRQLQEESRASGHGLLHVWPTGVRPQYGPILYLEPKTLQNVAVRGYDMFSEPVRHAAMVAARDTGQLRMTGRVHLVQDGGRRIPGLLLYAPVYRAGDRPESGAARRESMQGWVYAPFRIPAFIEASVAPMRRPPTFRLLDVTDTRPVVLHETPGHAAALARDDVLTRSIEGEHYGRRWRFEFAAAPALASAFWLDSSRITLAIGLLASLLLFGIAWLLAQTESRAAKLAGRMTAAYRQSEQQVRTLNRSLEARVARRTRELSEANRELEAFAYSVSHDLRAPLRAIDGFSARLLERHGAALDDTGRDYLARVRNAAARMSELIDALLALARVGRGPLQREDLDLSAMAAEVAEELRAGEPAREVVFEIAPGLHANGDPTLVRNLLHNLLGNAWKFSSGRTPARITFGPVAGRPDAFFVADNGVGFDQALAGKLFRPFQRLHAADEFAGHGIGLASVQRIVERHGGTLEARGEPDRGATLTFSLPAASNEA